MSHPFHLMAKPVNYQRNIACDYCFYLEKEQGTLKPRNAARHMDERTLEAFVRQYIEANPGQEVEFTWQGGEPTLAGIAFYEKALQLQRKYANGKRILNSIQTNGVLIDEPWAAFLAEKLAGSTATDWSVCGEQWGRFITAVFDLWVKKDVSQLYIQLFDSALAAWPGEKSLLCVMQLSCGFGLVVEQNGDAYSCDHYVYPEHRLGNLRRDSQAKTQGRRKSASNAHRQA